MADAPITPERPKWTLGVPRYALLDVWMALGGKPQVFERWMDEPRRTPADAWSQLLAWVSRKPPTSDTNPPCGPHPMEAL